MDDSPFDSVTLRLSSSKRLLACGMVLWAMVTALCTFIDLPVAVLTAYILVISFCFATHIYQAILLASPRSPLAITITLASIQVTYQSGKSENITLDKASLIHPKLTILQMRNKNRWLSKSLYLTVDNCDQENFRRLRVILLLRGKKFVIGS